MECSVPDVALASSFGSESDKVTLPNEDGSMDSAFWLGSALVLPREIFCY